jgi:hypothetical protein
MRWANLIPTADAFREPTMPISGRASASILPRTARKLNDVKGDNPNGNGKGEDISKVTYGDNVGPALPRGTKG